MIEQWQPTGKADKPPKPPSPAQVAKRRLYALRLCRNAANKTSYALADKMAKLWECEGCKALGIEEPNA